MNKKITKIFIAEPGESPQKIVDCVKNLVEENNTYA